MTGRTAIILAAGQGKRLCSSLPKPLHPIGGRSMLGWSAALCHQLGIDRAIAVVGQDKRVCGEAECLGLVPVVQHEQKGTGHAVLAAREALRDFKGHILILYADVPLVRLQCGEDLLGALSRGAEMSVLGFETERPGAYGRLVLSGEDNLDYIVEAQDASAREKEIKACNSGLMAAHSDLLWSLLDKIKPHNTQGEYYLTDTIGAAQKQGHDIKVVWAEEEEVLGANTRHDLARLETIFQQRMRHAMMEKGVSLLDPQTTYFSYDTKLARDTIVGPCVVFGPSVHVEEGSCIGAFSHLEGTHIGSFAQVGPFARLRPGAVLEAHTKVGNFVEIKKTRLGEGSKAGHLTYLGDADIGKGVNIGAGVITCNYDGFQKYKTSVGEGAFIGSNTSLVAPVHLGAEAYIGSGSTIIEDVPKNALALGRARQIIKTNWAGKTGKKTSS